MLLLGLDGEMSHPDISAGGTLIQAGLAVHTNDGYDTFCATINVETPVWSEQAAAVHNISRATLAASPDAAQVDRAASAWLTARGGKPGQRRLIPVGFNVVAFDLPFFRAALPNTAAMISRRGLDLNAVGYLLDGVDIDGTGPLNWAGWKNYITAAAAERLEQLAIPGGPHNAGWDAAEALACADILRNFLGGWRHSEPRAT